MKRFDWQQYKEDMLFVVHLFMATAILFLRSAFFRNHAATIAFLTTTYVS
jgi:hypothetical protein